MIRIVLDTNVLVSGMINAFGPPGRIVDLIREGHVELVLDDRIISEYTEVLNRPKFRGYFCVQDACDILVFLERNSHYIVPTVQVSDLPDPDDGPFLDAAHSAGVPLVTGNTDDFPPARCRSVEVLTPARFLKRMAR